MEKYGLLIDYHYCTGCHTNYIFRFDRERRFSNKR